MKVSKIPGLGRFGVFVDEVDFTTITNEEWLEIGRLHLENLVTIIRDCNLTWDREIDFCKQFGDTRYGVRYLLLKKYQGRTWKEIVGAALQDDPSIDDIDKQRLQSISRMQELMPCLLYTSPSPRD